jgi:hypothetical protein
VQNAVLLLAAVLLVVGGITGLLWARSALEHGALASVVPLLAGVAMLGGGISAAAWGASRLRFFFGRGRPRSLAPELGSNISGSSQAANAVKDLLRHGVLVYPEPRGALNGLLYHAMPHLITAPQRVQQETQRQFFNTLAIGVTLLSFAVSWLLLGNPVARPWLSLLYFGFGAYFVLRPVIGHAQADLGLWSLVLLIAAAIVGPVAAALLGHRIGTPFGIDLALQTSVMLLTALVAVALTMAALLAQVGRPPHTEASCEQLSLSMNAPPSALMDELQRQLQAEWTEKLPNRRYTKLDPAIEPARHAGSFAGELFEETQPLPQPGTVAPRLGSALAEGRHRWLVLLDLWGLLLVAAAVVCSLRFIHQFDLQATAPPAFGLAGVSALLALVALFCFRSAAAVWGRFNFESTLVWVELLGTWQTSRVGTGQAWTARLSTESEIVRTEAMTLRVWRARIESVVFGKDGERQVTAMFGTAAEAKALAAHLAAFARERSLLVAPEGGEDQRRMAALNRGEAQLGPGTPAAALHDALRTQAALASANPAARFCSACGAPAAAGARFCSACGAALSA